MWLPNGKASTRGKKGGRNGLVAVAIDKGKSSMHAMRWAADNLVTKGQTIILIHVLQKSSANSCCNYDLTDLNGRANDIVLEKPTKDLFLTFHCLCTRKDILCFDVVLEDMDIAKAITEYTAHAAIENLVLGASRHGFIRRLKTVDVPTSVSRASPEFCTIYVISKSKISSVRNASREAPFASPLLPHLHKIQEQNSCIINPAVSVEPRVTPQHLPSRGPNRTPPRVIIAEETEMTSRSPILARGLNPNMFMDLSDSDTDISFISSGRPSTDSRFMDTLFYDGVDPSRGSRMSVSSDRSSERSFQSTLSGLRFNDMCTISEYSTGSMENDEVEAEMRRLKLELQKTMDMYSTACKEALTANQKAVELHRWREDEEKRLEEAARVTAEQEKARYTPALENFETGQPLRYRKYSIEEIELATDCFHESRKIGEGGYGPVYKCSLDHTPVAVKVLRPDAAQGRSQFQQEVEVLSCLRHPNMVLLLGACPEYGSLVYEYMANGSLEDRLFRKGNTRPLSWQLRYRIAAEIATGLHFLHQTKPEPLVHRDLKPGNILLDQNYVSKISDVGLARLVPPSIADDVTQYRMTSTAGTFCYIDPEYQQTGMLGTKSDVYSLGVVLLQIITAKPAMGLTHHIGNAIEKGTLLQMLDPTVSDWPMEETLSYAKLALQCTELRRKDRPDLSKVVVPELNKLRELGEENMGSFLIGGSAASTPNHSFVSSSSKSSQGFKSDPNVQSVYSSVGDCPGSASMPGQ
ncbi:U-box domain-containing protein 34-like [Salvia divinorum]|uniref:RING-type E3 ubiquitin transferase n=1 Tax=Salvia divinorum TaxID=28513 RepID=A0ABD1FK17_SALDI